MKTPIITRLGYTLKLPLFKHALVAIPPIFLGLFADYKRQGIKEMLPEWEINFYWVAAPLICVYALVFLHRFLSAPLAIENEQLRKGRDLSQKIDDADLSRLLRGFIIENVFMYNGEGVYPSKSYDNKFSLEKIRESYDEVSFRCPADSIAHVTFAFMNGHANIDKTAFICVKDGNGDEQRINIRDIYQEYRIFTGKHSKIYIKLQYPDDYQIYDEASLRISLQAWEK